MSSTSSSSSGYLPKNSLRTYAPPLALKLWYSPSTHSSMRFSSRPVLSRGEQRIPVLAPEHLDHVPAGAAECRFQFVDDLAVAAHRTVQPLQVAVDDEDQVVELFARGRASMRAQRFGLVHLAVAQERPDLARRLRDDAAVLQIAHEARLVDRVDRPEAHRYRRELPEIRHQPGMRIRGQAGLLAQLVAEVFQMLCGQPAFEEGARVDARRGVALEINQVARLVAVAAVEEVVEADFEQRRQRRIGGDVAADARVVLILVRPPSPSRSSG